METIRRNLALADMDIRTDERGRRRIFSIKFVSKEGKVYFMPQAYACGAGRMNMKAVSYTHLTLPTKLEV